MEPITTGLAIYALNSDMAKRLLGPTIDYIGNEGKNLVERCNVNISDIFKKATDKASHKLDKEGQINPRVLRAVLNDGAFCESEIVKDYYAGILASSRNDDVEDDRGIMFMDILTGLTTSQVKLHHLIYQSLMSSFTSKSYNSENNHGLFIPKRLFGDVGYTKQHLEQALDGLKRNRLIDPEMSLTATIERLKQYNSLIDEEGFIVNPSRTGEALYMWSLGREEINFKDYIDISNKSLKIEDGLIVIDENIFIKTYEKDFGLKLDSVEW